MFVAVVEEGLDVGHSGHRDLSCYSIIRIYIRLSDDDNPKESNVLTPNLILDGALAGALVGFVLGLIGGGGSILAVPLLVYFVGVSSPHVAIGTSAVAVATSALVNVTGACPRKGG